MSNITIKKCDFCKKIIEEISNPHTLKAILPIVNKVNKDYYDNIILDWELHPSCALEISNFLNKKTNNEK